MVPGRRIDTWKAYELFHCTTICQRMPELKEDLERTPVILNGTKYQLQTEMVRNTNDTGYHAEYWLEPVKVEELQGVLF